MSCLAPPCLVVWKLPAPGAELRRLSRPRSGHAARSFLAFFWRCVLPELHPVEQKSLLDTGFARIGGHIHRARTKKPSDRSRANKLGLSGGVPAFLLTISTSAFRYPCVW